MRPTKLYVDYFVMPIRGGIWRKPFFSRATYIYAGTQTQRKEVRKVKGLLVSRTTPICSKKKIQTHFTSSLLQCRIPVFFFFFSKKGQNPINRGLPSEKESLSRSFCIFQYSKRVGNSLSPKSFLTNAVNYERRIISPHLVKKNGGAKHKSTFMTSLGLDVELWMDAL